MDRLTDQRGFTIVEAMVAAALLLIGVLGTLAMMDTANKKTRTASDRQGATALARDLVEAVRALPYRQVEPGSTLLTRLQAADGLAGNGSVTDWRIERNGTPYGVKLDVCALDDPADGLGARDAGGFCSDVLPAGTEDGSPADYKRVTATVSWSGGNGGGRVVQSTFVTSRGNRDAPAVTVLKLTSPAVTPITSAAVTSASFGVTTSDDADSVVWMVDGVQRGVAAGSGTNFSFVWSLPSLDGTYEIKAQAFDDSAMSGEPRSLTIALNRFPPTAPTGFNAGRNGSVVEAEWKANPEGDIIGYRVYRRQGATGTVTLACETERATECIDPNPPTGTSGTLDYWVVALDRDPANASLKREGPASARIDVNKPNSAPNAPTGLSLEVDGSGRIVLSWSLPEPGDPDPGDSIAFFRIYRGGVSVGDRYDRTGSGAATSWVDSDPGDGSHEYWITAVDTRLRESVLVGPVRVAVPEPDPEEEEAEPGDPEPEG